MQQNPPVFLLDLHIAHPVISAHAATGVIGIAKLASFSHLWSAWVHSEVRESPGQRGEVKEHRTMTNVTNPSEQPALLAAMEDTGRRPDTANPGATSVTFIRDLMAGLTAR